MDDMQLSTVHKDLHQLQQQVDQQQWCNVIHQNQINGVLHSWLFLLHIDTLTLLAGSD